MQKVLFLFSLTISTQAQCANYVNISEDRFYAYDIDAESIAKQKGDTVIYEVLVTGNGGVSRLTIFGQCASLTYSLLSPSGRSIRTLPWSDYKFIPAEPGSVSRALLDFACSKINDK